MTEIPQCCRKDSLNNKMSEEERIDEFRKKMSLITNELWKEWTGPHKMSEFRMSSVKPKPVKKSMKRIVTIKPGTHEERWQRLQQTIAEARKEINMDSPRLNPLVNNRLSTLQKNALAFGHRFNRNNLLVIAVDTIIRTHGEVMPFRCDNMIYTSRRMPVTLRRLDQIDVRNLEYGKRILDVVSDIDTGRKPKAPKLNRTTKRLKIHPRLLAKYRGLNIKMPKTNQERWLLFRPQVYFDIYLKDSRPLGRIVAELYTEAAPAVVMEIVKYCYIHNHEHFKVRRLFPFLWLDVKMPVLWKSALCKPRMDYDDRAIDHGKSDCVLPFRKDSTQGVGHSFTFSISFRPLKVCNGSRVGFGRIISGAKIFDCLQSYGNRNGKLSRGISFIGCGCL